MPYTQDEGGRLNNFANEPKMYQATPPTRAEQRNYIILGLAAMVLVGGLIFVAFAASKVS
jgi:hypothetical protein